MFRTGDHSVKVAFIGLASFVLLILMTQRPLQADNGPHGGYAPAGQFCTVCHRQHSGPPRNRLKQPVPELCLSCHGSGATGADTNVMDGIYTESDKDREMPHEGVVGRGLKGGGFDTALMDNDADPATAAVSAPATSAHRYDGGSGTAWGHTANRVDLKPGTPNGPPSCPGCTEPVYNPGTADFSLTCTSCHDPHGNKAYRILKPRPDGSGGGKPVKVPDEEDIVYTVADPGSNYMGEAYGERGRILADWCSRCHTRYNATEGSGHNDSDDPIFAFRHPSATDDVYCNSCHVAHGTSATMGVFSGQVEWPDGESSPGGDERSSLLRLDNRGICVYCHITGGQN